ncbi:MAG: TonB-dependent receptor [Candidatus Zixiibacteriota bacterium]|nr:MAG: TonB-dependent receptor [candidate division Zixibacteria bacterium]
MKRMIIIIAAVCLVCRASASESKSSVSGTILDLVTRQPVEGATVIISGTSLGTQSGSKGEFILPSLAPGDHVIRVSMIGYNESQRSFTLDEKDSRHLTVLLEPTTIPVDKITVTAGRFREEAFASTQSVSITARDKFASRSFSTTAEVLREEPGILVQKTTCGHGAPILRGLIGKYVLLLYDGIRLNRPTFRFGANQYLNTVDLESLNRIEVVRGPSSVMYGSDAIAGAINLIPESAPLDNGGIAITPYFAGRYSGADDGRSIHLSLFGTHRHFSASVGATYKKIDDLRAGEETGEQLPTGWEETDFKTRITYYPGSKTSLSLDYLATRQNRVPRYDKYVSGDFQQYIYDPQDRNLLALTSNFKQPGSFLNSVKTGISYQHEVEGRTEQKAGSDAVTKTSDKISTLGGFIQLSTPPLSGHWLSFGAEYYYDKIRSRTDKIINGTAERIRPTYPDDSRYRSAGIFLQDEWSLKNNLKLTAGIRYSLFGMISPLEAPFGEFDESYQDVTESLAMSFRPVQSLNVIGRWSRGFRAPNLNDAVVLKYSSSGVDAPSIGLKPEHSNNYEIGMKVNSQRGTGSLFFYYNQLSGLIDRKPGIYDGKTFYDENSNGIKEPGEFDIYQRYNVGSARIYGFEFESMVVLNDFWELRTNCFWTRGENGTEDEPMSRIPPLMGMAAVRLKPSPPVWIELFVRLAGEQTRLSARDIDDTRIDPGGTPGWHTVNFRAGFKLDGFFVSVSLENIGDETYKEHGSGIYSPGRNFMLTLSYKPM